MDLVVLALPEKTRVVHPGEASVPSVIGFELRESNHPGWSKTELMPTVNTTGITVFGFCSPQQSASYVTYI
jgi:hypothetical protein